MSNKVDIQAFRHRLFELVDTFAAGGAQFPFAFDELMCMWFDDLWWHPETLVKEGILSEREYLIVARFSDALRAVYPESSENSEQDLRKLQSNPTWLAVVSAAKKAQADLRDLKNSSSA